MRDRCSSFSPIIRGQSVAEACSVQLVVHYGRKVVPIAMAPHLSTRELDWIYQKARVGKTPVEITALLQRARLSKGINVPNLTNVRKVLKGKTYKRSQVETRGRKRTYTRRQVISMNSARKKLLKKAKGEKEVRWRDIQKAARVPKADRGTVLAAFKREGLPVQARRPRLKPFRTQAQADNRVDYAEEWVSASPDYWEKDVDMIIDNKHMDIPTTERARQYLAQQRVRFHLRTPAEGVLPECTKPGCHFLWGVFLGSLQTHAPPPKPSLGVQTQAPHLAHLFREMKTSNLRFRFGRKKNKLNTGARVNVCAGISNGKIVMWEYLGKTWNGDAAAKLVQGPVIETLRKERGVKRRYHMLEDNDPTGYKSGKALAAKAALGIVAVPMPAYSPDMNPLDFSLWVEIEQRMISKAPKRVESVDEYKKRMRLTALRLPRSIVSKAVRAIPKRLRALIDAKGFSIKID